jgi:hypothetical protein
VPLLPCLIISDGHASLAITECSKKLYSYKVLDEAFNIKVDKAGGVVHELMNNESIVV